MYPKQGRKGIRNGGSGGTDLLKDWGYRKSIECLKLVWTQPGVKGVTNAKKGPSGLGHPEWKRILAAAVGKKEVKKKGRKAESFWQLRQLGGHHV